MIKSIIFDIGSVVDKGNKGQHYKKMCKALGLDVKKFKKSENSYVDKACVGKISAKEHVSFIARDLGINKKHLMRTWEKFREQAQNKDKRLLYFIKKLKKKGYITGSITNVMEISDIARREQKMYESFDIVIKSFEAKTKKPYKKIFRIFLKKSGLKANECVFIDDLKYNVDVAKKLGMEGIVFENNNQIKKELKKMLD